MTKQRVHPPVQLRDGGGNIVDFQISCGVDGAQDISSGYTPPVGVNSFYICPLEAGDIVVQLVGQTGVEQFTILSARVEPNVGFWLEEKCQKIISATVTSALIGWSY